MGCGVVGLLKRRRILAEQWVRKASSKDVVSPFIFGVIRDYSSHAVFPIRSPHIYFFYFFSFFKVFRLNIF